MNAVIRRARPYERDQVVGLVSDASRWLGSRGLDQWQYPPRAGRIENGITAGEVWVLEGPDGELIGTMALDSRADHEFWRAEDDPQAALYAHRMVVARRAAGHGLGAEMLDWAGSQAVRAGKKWLRLDAWRTNDQLQRYYLAQGFEHLRTVKLSHRGSGALFQRPAYEVATPRLTTVAGIDSVTRRAR